jgi:hypothetical protein
LVEAGILAALFLFNTGHNMHFSWRQLFSSNRFYIGAVILSLLVTFLRTPLLNNTFADLALTVFLQLYLPGYLVARVVGKHRLPHPISRFAWVLACGLGLTVSLGALARLLNIPVPVYLLVLHGVMLLLALLPSPADTSAQPWRLTRKTIPLYVAVAISCLVVFGVSYESRYRFFGFEDQPIFISLVDWLAYHPDERPNDIPLRSRQIGVLGGDTRFDTDGWSYNQAGWVWASGVPARQIIWYDLGTLFIWAVPLLTFALAYELNGREGVAAGSAVALTLVGLLTLDNLVYNPSYTGFGRFVVFQINVLRQFSLTIMLPLALLVALSYLRTFQRRDLMIVALTGAALAAMHPIQVMIFVMSAGVTTMISWLAKPSREHFMKLLPFAFLLALILALPFVQRLNMEGFSPAPTLIQQDELESEPETATPTARDSFLVLHNLPLVGTTFIRNPANVFYSPVITLAVILGLGCGWWWRRSLAAQYIFSTTLLALVIFFTPGLAELFNKIASSVGLLTTMFMIPVPLAYGVGLSLIGESLLAGRKPIAALLNTEGLRWLGAAVGSGVMALLLFEPFPIPASARDQLRAYNTMQSLRYLHPAQEALSASLQAHLPPGTIAILATPYDVANVVIEDSPDTLITGGRRTYNLAYDGNNRFMNEGAVDAPWLDMADLEFLEKWGVTHIITLVETTRLAQMLLQPERFELLDRPSGYTIFRLKPDIAADTIDALYGEMNTLYVTMETPRWGRTGFNLILPGDEVAWTPIAEQWQILLDEQPDNEQARLGLAFTYTMMGADSEALPLWRALYEAHPDVPLYADALASTIQQVDPTQDSIAPLVDSLGSAYDAARVLAARRLLTDTFTYRLNDEQLQQVVGVMQTDAITWDRLANLGQQEPIRQRAALLMNAEEWTAAGAELDALPYAERAPEDLIARAAIQLVQDDVPGALDILKPTTDTDTITAKVLLHPDRWENNTAAQAYYLLLGDVAERDGHMTEARAAYQQAIDHGAGFVGKYFYNTTAGLEVGDWCNLDEMPDKWQQALKPPLQPLLSIADEGALYVMQPEETRADERILTVCATYGNARPRDTYPIQMWRIQVVSPDSETKYTEMDIPAEFLDGALVRVATDVTLPADIPELTSALVIIEPRYNDAVTTTPAILPIVLNRPESADIPIDAQSADLQFTTELGRNIALQAYQAEYEANTLNLTLYWQTATPLPEDYQVFVHVLDANGQQVGGGDSAPVNNRYPTSHWRMGVTIADPRTITLDPPLPPGDYTVRIGLYRLPSGERLAITPVDERVQDNSVEVYAFSIGAE